jgi:signal transduction histidine kinase
MDAAVPRNREEEQLRQREMYMQLAYDAANIGTLQHDLIADRVLFDDRAQAHYGMIRASATTAEMFARVYPEDLVLVQQWIASAAVTGSFSGEFRVVHDDGSIHWLAAHARVAFEGEGDDRRPVRSFGASQDITERKLAEEKLRLRTEELERLLDLLPAAVWIADDPLCHSVRGNRYANWLLNVSPDTNVSGAANASPNAAVRMRQLVDGQDVSASEMALQRAAQLGTPQLEVDLRIDGSAAGDVILAGGAVPLFDKNGKPRGAVAAFHDVTVRRRAERELAWNVEELRRSNLELEQFAYVASHDLQEPLRALSGMAQLLQQRYHSQLDGRGKEYIDLIIDAASRMQALIGALLSFSRVDRVRSAVQMISVDAALRNALANLDTAVRASGAQVTHSPLPMVRAEPQQLTQVLQNLIANAIKFRSEAAPEITVSVTDLPDAWQFSIRDNGIGIDPEHFERIFLIFQRLHTRTEYPGMGIGLALCRKVIERHGGSIWVDSQPGAGATFYFTLPKTDEVPAK